MASNQGAMVDISNHGIVQMEAGGWFEGDVIDDTMILVTSDAPVFVVQYMKGHTADGRGGGPAMMTVPSVESFVNNVTFPVVLMTYSVFRYNIHVTIKCNHTDGLIFDDMQSMSDWQRLETDDGEMCALRGNVTTGVHSVTHHDPEAKFTVAVYGINNLGRAYAYPAGYDPDLGKSIKNLFCSVLFLLFSF